MKSLNDFSGTGENLCECWASGRGSGTRAPKIALDLNHRIDFVAGAGEKVLKLSDHLGHGVSAARIEDTGGDLVERNKDKGALGEARMRDDETGSADDEIAIEENVEVEGAGAVGDAGDADAAEFLFDEEHGAEQLEWGQLGFKSDCGVEEAGLIGESNGRGGVERGARRHTAQGLKARGGGGQRSLGRAGVTGEVGTESDSS